jgi:cytoskeletal protein CcmA (bactofilin family)
MSTETSAAAHGRKTLVEEGTTFKGSLSSSCPVEVKGNVEGDITAPALSVSASGTVHGRIKVGEMRSQGELAGEFDADAVHLSGTIKNSTVIRAKSLEVKLAPAEGKMQVVFGECQLEVGTEEASRVSVTPPAEAPSAPADRSPKAPSVPPEHAAKNPAGVTSERKIGPVASEPAPRNSPSGPPELARTASARPPADSNGA